MSQYIDRNSPKSSVYTGAIKEIKPVDEGSLPYIFEREKT